MNRKKLLVSLLGGGIGLTVASLGGIKLSEKISYNRKIYRFRKIASDFTTKSNLTPDEGNWYLADYKDDEAWQMFHSSKHSGSDNTAKKKREIFIKENPDWTTFRDNCYAQGERGFDECGDSLGWCMECARNDSWSLEKSRKNNS